MSWEVSRAARVFAELAEELDRLVTSLKAEFAEEDIKLIRRLRARRGVCRGSRASS